MIEIHDFKFVLSDSFAIDASIEDHRGHFEAEYITPAYRNGGPRTLIHANHSFPDARTAFDWIVGEVLRFASSQSLAIAWIDNPCNDPFVKKADQIAQLGVHQWTGPLLVNGQP